MIVVIGKSSYEVEEKNANMLLDYFKRAAAGDIYAVKQGNVIIALNDKYSDAQSLKKAISSYEAKGFTVYCK